MTTTHLLKFSSLSEVHEWLLAFNPDFTPKTQSSFTNCSIGKLCKHFS